MPKSAPPVSSLTPGPTVVYRDEGLLVLTKPSGVPSVPHDEDEQGTAVSAALALDSGLRGIGDRRLEHGLLHRLDTGTSGLLAFARTPKAFEFYKLAWKERRVRKVYRAVSRPELGSRLLKDLALPLVVDWPISHSAKSSRRMVVHVTGRRIPKSAVRGKAQEALTRVLEAKRITPARPGDRLSLDLTVEIETGVMHQIRAHLAALDAPIVGDPVYGDDDGASHGLWLHAWKLGLPRMTGGGRRVPDDLLWLEAPLPSDWPK